MNSNKYCGVFFFPILLLISIFSSLTAQNLFGDLCAGNWSGKMYLSNQGQITDSIFVTMEIAKIDTTNSWKWKTSYEAKPDKIIKDYVLKSMDPATGFYTIDEGDGIELSCYQFNNKLYSTFEVSGKILTAIYEFNDDILYFEVTSGKKEQATGNGSIFNYSVDHVQRVIFSRN